MVHDHNVREALLTQLKTVVDEKLIAEENKEFERIGLPWIRETLLPGVPERVEIMLDGMSRQFGVYQVNVYTPVGIGTSVADDLGRSIADAFVPGTTFAHGDVSVKIRRVYARPGTESGNYYQKPIVIDWWIMES